MSADRDPPSPPSSRPPEDAGTDPAPWPVPAEVAGAFLEVVAREDSVHRRLAGQMHDGVVQQLIAATWQLEELDPDEESLDIQSIRAILGAALTQVRAVISELRPPGLGLVPLPGLLVQRAAALLGDDVAVTVTGRVPAALGDTLDTVILRVAVEALNNVRQHAHATTVVIGLGARPDGSGLTVTVTDDGVGMPAVVTGPPPAQATTGLERLRLSTYLSGGFVRVGARPDGAAGTELRFELPASPAAPSAAEPVS